MAHDEIQAADYRPLDALLESLAPCGAELDNTLTNHAPMVVEALCALGRGDAAHAWLDAYRRHLLPWPPPCRPITADDTADALGDPARVTDWDRFFTAELARAPWRTVVATWVPRLTPGISAAATHGVIRTGHAVRSLGVAQTLPRQRELAAALAYWAASYRELPHAADAGGSGSAGGTAAWALAQVPLLPARERRHRGSIDAALAPLEHWPEFRRVDRLLDVDRDPAAVAGELQALFTRVLLDNAVDFLTTIVFVHAVTSLVAVQHLFPLLTDADRRRALRFGWQAAAALYSVYGTRAPRADRAIQSSETVGTIVDLAIRSGDEHAIKFTEACVFAAAHDPSPIYLAAACHATRLLSAA